MGAALRDATDEDAFCEGGRYDMRLLQTNFAAPTLSVAAMLFGVFVNAQLEGPRRERRNIRRTSSTSSPTTRVGKMSDITAPIYRPRTSTH